MVRIRPAVLLVNTCGQPKHVGTQVAGHYRVIGGLGSLAGALLGGILIGVCEALAGFLFQPSMKSMFSFLLLIAVLALRPQGLLGRIAAR